MSNPFMPPGQSSIDFLEWHQMVMAEMVRSESEDAAEAAAEEGDDPLMHEPCDEVDLLSGARCGLRRGHTGVHSDRSEPGVIMLWPPRPHSLIVDP